VTIPKTYLRTYAAWCVLHTKLDEVRTLVKKSRVCICSKEVIADPSDRINLFEITQAAQIAWNIPIA